MRFEPLLIPSGHTEMVTEYSLLDPGIDRWIEVEADGRMSFGSLTPVSLRHYFDDPDAGTHGFAVDLVTKIRDWAATGEVVSGLWVDASPEAAKRAVIAQFRTARPAFAQSGLEINRDFQSDKEMFEVRGPTEAVSRYVIDYLRQYPPVLYETGTALVGDDAPDGRRTMRIWRKRGMDS